MLVTENGHPVLELQDLLDGVLGDARRAEVDAHLAQCNACTAELTWLRAGRNAARSIRTEVPEGLDRSILSILDEEDRLVKQATAAPQVTPTKDRRWRWLAAAAVLVAGVGLVLVLTSIDPERPALPSKPEVPTGPAIAASDLADDVANNFVDFRDGRLTLAVSTQDADELERYFDRAEMNHDVRVLDLAMMEYGVDGGRVLATDPPRAMFVYDGPGDVRLMCQMFLLAYAGLPDGGERRTHNGIEFVIYERQGVTLVFWMEGDVMCVLSSDIGREEVVGLAFAKAMAAVRQEA
jgi:anti-sigma factor RsiW